MNEGKATKRGLVLAMLLVVYTFNFVDRQILAILAGPIKADLHLTDAQLGMLGGLAFAILYSTLGVPLGWLADRTRRTWVITGSLALWSGFTALCGVAGSFGSFFLCRLGVGIGEAGGVAPSYALISDVFPPERRARALSIYSLGIPFGSALGILFGGYVASHVDWRTALIAVGLAGVVFTPVFGLVVKDPPRPTPGRGTAGAAGGGGAAVQPPSDDGAPSAMLRMVPLPEKSRGGTVFAILAAKKSFWLLSFGAASSSICGYGLGFWLPSLMRRSFGLDLIGTSYFFGALLLIGGSAGILGGGWLADRLGGRDRAAYARLPALAFAIGVPLFAAGMLCHSTMLAFALFLLPQALVYVWLGTVLAAVQHLVPAAMRATASASFLLINNLIGVGLGAMSIGALSDRLTPAYGVEALRYACVAALGFYLLAALLMALAARHLRREWVA